jgi:hypothetical protein
MAAQILDAGTVGDQLSVDGMVGSKIGVFLGMFSKTCPYLTENRLVRL